MDESFDTAWRQVALGVLSWCRREMRDDDQAAELCQRVMIRAWRGHATFRGDCAYQTWVVRIAIHEAARLHAAIARRREREERVSIQVGHEARRAQVERGRRGGHELPGETERLAIHEKLGC